VADIFARGQDGCECQCSACGHEFHFASGVTPFDGEPLACLGVDEE
jgi:hypothetical protein